MTVVLTLKAHAIKRGPMILTECKMAELHEGDLIHCLPAMATDLLAKYPHNLKIEGEHKEHKGEWPTGQRYVVEGLPIPAARVVKPQPQHNAPDYGTEAVITHHGHPQPKVEKAEAVAAPEATQEASKPVDRRGRRPHGKDAST